MDILQFVGKLRAGYLKIMFLALVLFIERPGGIGDKVLSILYDKTFFT